MSEQNEFHKAGNMFVPKSQFDVPKNHNPVNMTLHEVGRTFAPVLIKWITLSFAFGQIVALIGVYALTIYDDEHVTPLTLVAVFAASLMLVIALAAAVIAYLYMRHKKTLRAYGVDIKDVR